MLRSTLTIAATFLLFACSSGNDAEPTTEEALEQGTVYMSEYIPWPPEGKDIKETESGLQYIILSEGEPDGASPGPRDRVVIDFDGRTSGDQTFHSTFDDGTPARAGVTQFPQGWSEAVQRMSEGEEIVAFVPNDLAFKNQGAGIIRPGEDLIIRIILRSVEPAPEPVPVSVEAWAEFTPWDSSRPEVVKTGSGLEYVVIESGSEDGRNPGLTDAAVVHYEGRLNDTGDVFDSSFSRGEPAQFEPRGVISGWTEALQLMRPGDRWLLHIPGDLAYGPMGSPPKIPPNAALNFEVELLDVLSVR